MDEVDPRLLVEAGQQARGRRCALQGVPLHLGVLLPRRERGAPLPGGRRARARPGSRPSPRRGAGSPRRSRGRGPRGATASVDHGVEAGGPQGVGAGPEGPHPREDHGVGRGGPVGIRLQPGVGPEVLEGLLGGAEVADAVVEDGDHRPGGGPSVTGPPWWRGSPRGVLDPHGVAQGPGHALERGLDDVVGVLPAPQRMWRVRAGGRGEGPPELLGQLGVERRGAEREGVGGELDAVGQVRAARQVQGHLHQRLVEGQGDRGEPPDAGLVAQGLGQRPRPGRSPRPPRCGGRRRRGRPRPAP